MLAFFPSCEQVDFLELQNKPIAVTNGDSGTTIISSSYEARAYGIKTGMRIQEALTLCPHLIKRASRPKRYAEISSNIINALRDITPDLEVFSIDECWMDLKPIMELYGGIDNIAEIIRKTVYESSGGIKCSIGISEGKLTAKFVAGVNKGKTTIVSSEYIKRYMSQYPLSKMCGIGPRMQEFLHSKHCNTIGDIQNNQHDLLSSKYGVVGKKLQQACNGIDTDSVITKEKLPKSMGHSKVLPPATVDKELVFNILLHLTYRLTRRMRLLNIVSKTVTIYLSTQNNIIKNTYTFDQSNNCNHEFMQKIKTHMKLWNGQPLFQIGIKCSELIYYENEQFDLFSDAYDSKYLTIDKTMDQINQKFGANACKSASEIFLTGNNVVPVIAFNFNATSKNKNSL
jgi:DNA polymerase-4